jgi:malonate transporter and related proteins
MELAARIAPFFALIAAGAVLARLRILDERVGRWLSAYTYWIGFPALLVSWLGSAPPPDAGLARALAIYAVTMGMVLGLAMVVGRVRAWPPEARAGVPMVAAVGNTAFLGAPLAASVLGEAARAPAAAIVAVDFILLLGVGVAVLQGGRNEPARRGLRRVLLNPTVVGAVIGLTLSAFRLRLPEPAAGGLALIALTASPVALVALGGLIGRERALPARAEFEPLGAALLLKLGLAPVLVWLALEAAGTARELIAAAVLLAACPTAVNVFIQTRAADVFARPAAQAVALGTVISALTLTLAAHILA